MSHDQEHNSDPDGSRSGYILGNDYAPAYVSKWSRELSKGFDKDHGFSDHVLRHMNCSYFSTTGQAPTLLSLKQHAQSLAHAITILSPSAQVAAGLVGEGDANAQSESSNEQNHPIARHEAMDFLASLTKPYSNDDPDHHRRLNSLLNEVSGGHDIMGTQYHCPVADCDAPRDPEDGNGPPDRVMPYASHHNLLMHANACLERLDHELSAQGGILSVLPQTHSPHEAEQLRAARNTLLGQLLTFVQALVGRMHELERQYANMADVLAGAAVVPRQQLSAVGVDGRAAGAPIAYPQDRWILANAGDEVLNYVHDLLDRREAKLVEKEHIWEKAGVMGTRVLDENHSDTDDESHDDDGEISGQKRKGRGIAYVDITTRYYRARGRTAGENDKGTIFVVPAWKHHPALYHTAEVEARPTVVTVPDPHVPDRISVLQDKYEKRITEGAKAADENIRLSKMCKTLQDDVKSLTEEGLRAKKMNEIMQDLFDKDNKGLVDKIAQLSEECRVARGENDEAAMRIWRANKLSTESQRALRRAQKQINDLTTELDKTKFEYNALRRKDRMVV
ncbi:hypothetical protein PpBr36_00977 [Pyricularia pennisetigena]|uniref:hypothetical protein n=1 Tax=Pyricularia pennisetigena TaxID=1578925 RepID=UPI0011513C6E|nr:hypothetical protein PpBr36_00977 [Pyricularia pennisetigena]TLS28339.1 hypothetical protein PpBr36_00977 [Pyricularia pennisetigena]